MNYNIMVTLPLSDSEKTALETQAPNCSFSYVKRYDVTKSDLEDKDIILGNIGNPSDLKDNTRLKFIQLNSAGYEEYAKVLSPTVKLANAKGAYGLAVSENTIGVLFELKKKLHLYRDNQNKNLWQPRGSVTSIYNSKIIITGLGDIGSELAKKLKSLGAYIIGIKRDISVVPDCVNEVTTLNNLKSLLPQADVVINILPLSPHTNKLFDYETLSLMKKDSIFINAGRGQSVDTSALIQLLNEGHFSGVGLDVFENEPLEKNSPLWNIERVVITPHIAGQFNLRYTLDKVIEISTYNLHAFINNKELINLIKY